MLKRLNKQYDMHCHRSKMCFNRLFTLLIFSFLITQTLFSQETILFKEDSRQKYGFDALEHDEWKDQYGIFKSRKKQFIYEAYKTVEYNQQDFVSLVFRGIDPEERENVRIFIGQKKIGFTILNDSTWSIKLPAKKSDYSLKVVYRNQDKAKLLVKVQKEITEKIIVIPLAPFKFDAKEIREKVNAIYGQANLGFDVYVADPLKSKVFESSAILSNPDTNHNEYTGQMRLLRDLYFEKHPKMEREAYFIFIIEGFQDPYLNGFMVKNKSMAFLKKSDNLDFFAHQLARTLGFGVGALDDSWKNNGPLKGTSINLMDTLNEVHLTHFQWNRLRKTPNYYSFYDNEENVRTNNGTIAYYFWKEDRQGNIVTKNGKPIKIIKRPYKHNFLSYHFKVKYLVLRPFYKIGNYFVSVLDIIFLVITLLLLYYISYWLRRIWQKKGYKRKFWRRIIFISIVGFTSIQVYDNYWVTNRILNYFKIVSGPVKELDGLSYQKAKRELLYNENLLHQEVSGVTSEILINRKGKWTIKKRAKVLYLTVWEDDKGKSVKTRFVSSSDRLILKSLKYNKKAYGHYMVITYLKPDGNIHKQKVYNYFGVEVSSKLLNENPPKRILLLVNGYRPTSIGQTFEENFSDVQNNGLEFPNSKNFIYNFDRFDYWQPWGKINLLFEKRINPNETYYADGHFSVTTSNYRSLINFTSTSSLYPKRCKNPKKHTCHKIENATLKQLIFSGSKTINQLHMFPNKKGFNYRKYKGKIAGKNLLQLVNEIPGHSKNDTLYIVAHSMGFAYSLGIIEELRGKINFGGFYIIAPENGKTGKINPKEWKEVWQYGSNLYGSHPDEPCLQDGIAPQSKVQGLPIGNHVFTPENRYDYKGYFDSHFIGYYKWILEIQKNKPGYISEK